MTKYFMGISALHHDSCACIITDTGDIVNVSQEERRTNIKNNKAWPQKSIDWCIKDAQLQGHDVSSENLTVGYYEKPWLKFSRRIYQNPKDFKKYFKEAASVSFLLAKNAKIVTHHKAHAIAGCATAPFSEGIYLTVDAIGEWETTTWGTFDHNKGIKQKGNIKYPHSLGLLYSAFTRWLGLKPNEDEYIVMGAAAYGQPTKVAEIWQFIKINKNGTFSLTKNIHRGVEQYLGQEIPPEDWYDWCASIQKVFEEVMSNLIWMLTQKYGNHLNLVLGGGCALNCSNNSRILREHSISNIWILPSPGDSGNALGAAAYVAGLSKLNWDTPFLGADIDLRSNPTSKLIRDVVGRLERGEIVGWIQGREEFGPRALGHRSLLADPRRADMKDRVNEIKRRQEFRPFAPAVLEEKAFSYFDIPNNPLNTFLGKSSSRRYMQFVDRVRDPEALPAITHFDGTARVQTVPKSTDPFRRLLEHWEKTTGCAVLLNTSLNIKGHPILSERRDAMKMFLDEPMDALVIGNRLYSKTVKMGLSEDGSPTIIADFTDYSDGADKLVAGRF